MQEAHTCVRAFCRPAGLWVTATHTYRAGHLRGASMGVGHVGQGQGTCMEAMHTLRIAQFGHSVQKRLAITVLKYLCYSCSLGIQSKDSSVQAEQQHGKGDWENTSNKKCSLKKSQNRSLGYKMPKSSQILYNIIIQICKSIVYSLILYFYNTGTIRHAMNLQMMNIYNIQTNCSTQTDIGEYLINIIM